MAEETIGYGSPEELDAIIEAHKKGDLSFDGKFTLSTFNWRGNHSFARFGEQNNVGELYSDGWHGVVLKASTDINTAAVAIASYDLDSSPWGGARDEDERTYPRIIQLQGLTKKGDKRQRRSFVMQALSSISMEDVLVDLVIEAAKKQGFPAVAILPAFANPNRRIEGFDLERARKRYDGTAIRRGFAQQSERNLYVLEL